MSLKRKDFLKGIAIGTLSLPVAMRAILGKNFAQSTTSNRINTGKRYEWKMVTTWPPKFPILGDACELFASVIESMSDGRIKIKVYGGGELVPALETFNTVRNGGAELGCGAAYYWAGIMPAGQFLSSVPFGMNAQQLTSWILCGGGMELWEELYRDYNVVPFLGGNTGCQMGGWFNREINSLADLKGLKMRIPGLGGRVLQKAGGTPVLMAGGEIYTSLERGVLDAAEWIGPYHDMLIGFHEIAKYYYYPGWQEAGTALEFTVNKEKYDELPEDLQAIIRSAALHVNSWLLAQMEASNAGALSELLSKGVKIRKFPPEVLDQLRKYNKEVIEELADSDPFARRAYDSYSAFRKKMNAWADLSEREYYESISIM